MPRPIARPPRRPVAALVAVALAAALALPGLAAAYIGTIPAVLEVAAPAVVNGNAVVTVSASITDLDGYPVPGATVTWSGAYTKQTAVPDGTTAWQPAGNVVQIVPTTSETDAAGVATTTVTVRCGGTCWVRIGATTTTDSVVAALAAAGKPGDLNAPDAELSSGIVILFRNTGLPGTSTLGRDLRGVSELEAAYLPHLRLRIR